ncbi:cation:proton antiporter [Roseivivax sp. CAU 1753]
MPLELSLIALGALFLAGLAADTLGRRTKVPRVTILLILGVIIGAPGFDLIPGEITALYELLSILALTMVAFLLGSAMRIDTLRQNGRAILWVSGAIVVVTMALVSSGLWLLGAPPETALVLGAIATATAPAATRSVLQETGATGPFADTIEGIVAIDDAWGMIAFALAMVGAQMLAGGAGADHGPALLAAAWEVAGSILLGLALGLPAAFLTGRISAGEPSQTEALGLVFLVSGLAIWLDLSFLLTGMTVGTVIVNRAVHHDYAFHEIEHIEWPFLTLFFLLAGATLELGTLGELGLLGAGYVLLRVVARLAGGMIGGWLGGMPPLERRWIGPALLPQAGVAVGMALIAAERLPNHGEVVLSLTIGTTVIFELFGPLTTALALRRVRNPPPE